ncbi:MAG: hypothetical protein PHO76_12985 [Methylotenera sp.]|nr:hypothetical protein [Methylotenera sp.]MDD4926155.1 hypothetical protein [Methylotenera sp.]
MSNIVKFETPDMGAARFFRENREEFKASAQRMQNVIDNPNKSDRAKLEARMVKAMVEFDDVEYNRTITLLKRIDLVGLQSLNGGKTST